MHYYTYPLQQRQSPCEKTINFSFNKKSYYQQRIRRVDKVAKRHKKKIESNNIINREKGKIG